MKKNYYELTDEEIIKYTKEWEKTPYFKMTIRSLWIAVGIFFACALFILVLTIFDSDLFSICIGLGLSVLVIIIGMITCVKTLMKLENDFPRWLKVKYDIDY